MRWIGGAILLAAICALVVPHMTKTSHADLPAMGIALGIVGIVTLLGGKKVPDDPEK